MVPNSLSGVRGDKFMEYAQMAGMILLLGLMAYALGLDFWRLLK